MRYAVGWVALLALTLGSLILVGTVATAHNSGQVIEAALTDFAVALIDLAITIGVVDLLLKSYSKQQHRQSVSPRVDELATHLRGLSVIAER